MIDHDQDGIDVKDLDFSTIYAEFRPKILRYVSMMIGDADAEDLAQEIFIKVRRSLNVFRGDCKLSTWLYRIATNAALDHLRRRTHLQNTSMDSEDTSAMEIDDRDIWTGEKLPVLEWQVVRKEMSACVQEYIQKLPENYRTVLVLSDFEGLSNQEIMEILGVSVSTVKIRLHRARQRLKKDLVATCPSYWVDGNEFLPDLKDL